MISNKSKINKNIYFLLFKLKYLILSLKGKKNQLIVMRWILVRNGEATHNVKKVYNTDPNHGNYKESTLTEKGKTNIEESRKLISCSIENLFIVRAHCSPLPRSRASLHEMRSIIPPYINDLNKHRDQLVDERLIEINAGSLEGKAVLKTDDDGTDSLHAVNFENYGGESVAQATERVKTFMSDVRAKIKEKGYTQYADVLIVTHGKICEIIHSLLNIKGEKLARGEITIYREKQ